VVIVEVPPAVTVAGLKLTLTPDGAPEADSVTDCAAPDTTAVDTVEVVDAPGLIEPDFGFSDTEKSLVGLVDELNFHWLAEPEQLPATTLVPEARTHFWPVWMSEIVPLGLTDHCWAGPPVHLSSPPLPLDFPGHGLCISGKGP